jgi:dsDNA-binding SOS-regulon protein
MKMKKVSWQRIQAIETSLSKEEFAVLAKYRARRNYAIGFTSGDVAGMTKSTSDAYDVMLKLGLAFTAAELLARVTGQKNSLGIKSEAFAKALNQGKFDKLLQGIEADHLRRYPNSSPNQLKKWQAATPKTDLTALVSQFRNYMFHGSFSPTESGLAKSKALRDLVLDLSNQTIESCEMALDKWLKTQETKTGGKRQT